MICSAMNDWFKLDQSPPWMFLELILDFVVRGRINYLISQFSSNDTKPLCPRQNKWILPDCSFGCTCFKCFKIVSVLGDTFWSLWNWEFSSFYLWAVFSLFRFSPHWEFGGEHRGCETTSTQRLLTWHTEITFSGIWNKKY